MSQLSSFVANLVSTVKSTAIEVVEETKKGVAMMRSFPTSVLCAACEENVSLPNSYWDWTCDTCESHLSSAVPMCCGVKRPTSKNTYTHACPGCSAILVVPTSNASQIATQGWNTTKTFVMNAPTKAREAYEHATALPVQFNCKNCNVLLDRPRDEWQCTVCRVDNDWSAPRCLAAGCAEKKNTRPPQRVMCGVCQKPTAVPTTNIANTFTYGKTQITRNLRKVQYTVGKKAYITCTSCSEHVAVPPERIVDAPEGGGNASAAARYSVDDDDDNEDNNNDDANTSGGGGGSGEGALVPGVYIPIGDATIGVDVIACTACGANLEYTHRTVVLATELPLTNIGSFGASSEGNNNATPLIGADGGGIQALRHVASTTTAMPTPTPTLTAEVEAAEVAAAVAAVAAMEVQPSSTSSSSLAAPLLETSGAHEI